MITSALESDSKIGVTVVVFHADDTELVPERVIDKFSRRMIGFIIDCKCVFKKLASSPNSSLALELFKALMVFVTQPLPSFLN